MGTQLGFAEALLNPMAGRNRRLEAIDVRVDWPPIQSLLAPPLEKSPS